MAKAFPIKMRARISSSRHTSSKKKASPTAKLKKLESLEKELEAVSEQVHAEIDEIEELEDVEAHKMPEFAWIKGDISHLLLQDFVGAAFGAIFFVVTQEVWDISARLGAWQAGALVLISFLMGYSLIYFSRRRKNLSRKVYHNVFMRCFEMYVVSFAVSIIFVMLLQTAPLEAAPMLKQASLVAMPGILSAATADLLFY